LSASGGFDQNPFFEMASSYWLFVYGDKVKKRIAEQQNDESQNFEGVVSRCSVFTFKKVE
jgi:hypothetical protein